MLPSLHPGGEGSGNPALNYKDVDPMMRVVFYPGVVGWTLLGVWMVTLRARIALLKEQILLKS